MAREPKKLDQLFHDTLKDIYFAEKKILSALPGPAFTLAATLAGPGLTVT
jgi:ferritin-like metal-binding protein YciE